MIRNSSDLIWQDKQHLVLFELIDQISANQVDASVFRRLYDYAENHFAVEEEYMLRLDYPQRVEHVKAHDRFRAELDSMMQSYHEYDESFRQALAEFLSSWLTSHIFGIDKALEEFILKSDCK